MFTVTVDKECGCFKKSDLENNQNYENNDTALMAAQEMVTYMNEDFCKKHSFTLSENGRSFSIAMNVPQKTHSGCCGGGHCS